MVFIAVNTLFSNGSNVTLSQTLVNKIIRKINEERKGITWIIVAQECVLILQLYTTDKAKSD